MGKSKRGDKEFSRLQKLVHENKELKRQVMRLRKDLARLDLDRFTNVKELIEESYTAGQESAGTEVIETLKKTWACQEASCEGYLEIILYNKLQETWYFRKCSCCTHRTKAQKYDPIKVKGIIKNS